MTPAEALARALGGAPNVAGHLIPLFAHADRAEIDRLAAGLAALIAEFTAQEPWPPEDVAALAEGIAGGGGQA